MHQYYCDWIHTVMVNMGFFGTLEECKLQLKKNVQSYKG